MIVTNRLLTTGSVISAVFSRNVHIVTFQQEFKIIHMTDVPQRNSILRNFRKSNSAKYSTNGNSFDCMENLEARQDFKQNLMEPLIKVCNEQKNLATCELTSHLKEKIITINSNNVKSIVNCIDIDTIMGSGKKNKNSMNKQKYKSIRTWRPLAAVAPTVNLETHFIVRILSYNILAQNLLEGHYYLYREHNKESLNWEKRMILVQKEILRAEANVICLQEMQVDHLKEFLAVFIKAGYDYLYKKRTNDKRDGLLLLYRADQLKLVDHAKVELYQENIDILNRDNVALVAKFSLIESPETHIVISTTHLLYNPRRDDVRLAQTQLLLTEVERMAFIKFTKNGPHYHPIILSGDFNLQPHTGVYRFITEGSFEYKGKGRNLEPAMICGLGNTLIPPSLLVTDSCTYFHLLVKRLRNENGNAMNEPSDDQKDCSDVRERTKDESKNEVEVNIRMTEYQKVEIVEGQYANFSSGGLTHPFRLDSLYRHTNHAGEAEATTHQEKWVTVDYIFYSDVEPIEKYNLPTVNECKNLPTIPNNIVGSDHLCLGASFILKKTKR